MQRSHWSRSGVAIASLTMVDVILSGAHVRARMAEAFYVQIGTAAPAGQEPVKLVARAVERRRMQGPDHGKLRLQVHQVVETVDQFAQLAGAAYHVVEASLLLRRLAGGGGVFCSHREEW